MSSQDPLDRGLGTLTTEQQAVPSSAISFPYSPFQTCCPTQCAWAQILRDLATLPSLCFQSPEAVYRNKETSGVEYSENVCQQITSGNRWGQYKEVNKSPEVIGTVRSLMRFSIMYC